MLFSEILVRTLSLLVLESTRAQSFHPAQLARAPCCADFSSTIPRYIHHAHALIQSLWAQQGAKARFALPWGFGMLRIFVLCLQPWGFAGEIGFQERSSNLASVQPGIEPPMPFCLKMVSVDTTRAEIRHVGACHVACHVARPMGQLIAAICSDTCIDDIEIDPHGLACAQHVAFVAPETPRIGGFGRPLRVVF